MQHGGRGVHDPEALVALGERLDLVAPDHPGPFEVGGGGGDVVGDDLQPDLGMAEPGDPVDPELLEQTGISLTPEGNAHQAEFTVDNRFFIGTDEDFAPYRTDEFEITTGPNAGVYPSVIVSGGQAPAILPDLTLSGPVEV